MRTIGIDLAISGTHKAVVADEQANLITSVIRLSTDSADLERLLHRAGAGAVANAPLRAVMEPTGGIGDRSSTANMPRATASAPRCWRAYPGLTPTPYIPCSWSVRTT